MLPDAPVIRSISAIATVRSAGSTCVHFFPPPKIGCVPVSLVRLTLANQASVFRAVRYKPAIGTHR